MHTQQIEVQLYPSYLEHFHTQSITPEGPRCQTQECQG